MSNENFRYVKLPGNGSRESSLFVRGGGVRLWLGDDHVLQVETEGYSEKYKRFYFKDIQGVTIRRSVDGRFVNFLLGAPMTFFAAIAISVDDGGLAAGMAFMAGIFLFFLIINIVRGPTCKAMLFTAVQDEPLVTCHRVKTAKKLLARLQPLIAAAQGELRPEEVISESGAVSPPMGVPAAAVVEPEVPYRSKTHTVLSWLALSDVLGTALIMWVGPELGRVYSLMHMVALLAIALIALTKQKNTTLPVGLKRLPVVLLVGLVGCFITAICMGIYMAASQPHTATMIQENPYGAPWQVVMTVISTSINGLAGFYGVVRMRSYRQSLQAVAPPPIQNPPEPPLTPDTLV